MLFNLFGKKEHPLGEHNYEYERTINGATYTITVDLSYEEAFLKKKTFENVIVVAFTLLHTEGEHARLIETVATLAKDLRSVTKTIFVGTIQDSNMLIGYITTLQPVDEDSVKQLLGKPKQTYTVTLSSDPGWVFLTPTLFPTLAERQHMSNQEMVALVKAEQGKDATPPTGVQHSVLFKGIEGSESFVKEVTPLGYTKVGMQPIADRSYPLMLVFSKACSISLSEMNAQTDFLIGLLEKHGGLYQGWQASAIDSGLPPAEIVQAVASTPFEQMQSQVIAPVVVAAAPVPPPVSTPDFIPNTPAPTAFEQVNSAPLGVVEDTGTNPQ